MWLPALLFLLPALPCLFSTAGISQAVTEPRKLHQQAVSRAPALMASALPLLLQQLACVQKLRKRGKQWKSDFPLKMCNSSLNNNDAVMALQCIHTPSAGAGSVQGTLGTEAISSWPGQYSVAGAKR